MNGCHLNSYDDIMPISLLQSWQIFIFQDSHCNQHHYHSPYIYWMASIYSSKLMSKDLLTGMNKAFYQHLQNSNFSFLFTLKKPEESLICLQLVSFLWSRICYTFTLFNLPFLRDLILAQHRPRDKRAVNFKSHWNDILLHQVHQ